MKLTDPEKVAEVMEGIARCLELKGENPFKVRAYLAAARALNVFAGDFAEVVASGKLGEIDGIGKAIEEKITRLCELGHLPYSDDLRAEFPPALFELFELQGMGSKKIKALYDKLGVDSIAALAAASSDGRIASLPGFGEKSAQNFLKAIEAREKFAGQFRLGDVWAFAENFHGMLRAHPDVTEVSMAGSLRRRKEVVHDLDFLVSTKAPELVADAFLSHAGVDEVVARGATKVSVRTGDGLQCDLRMVTPAEFPFALAYFTGSKEHNVAMRSRALKRGWTLNEYRLAPVPGSTSRPEPVPDIHSEADLHQALGLEFIEPELREATGEIEAAESGRLPRLIELSNLRGTFHNHTNSSDGRNTVEQMARGAIDLGLEYLGIADHSKSSVQANGLDEKRLLAQIEEIRALNSRFDGFRLFAGVECDILKDGRLDFSDEILSRLDYVVVSVHASFTLPEKEMTGRIIRAMQSPFATMLGHPTGRLLLSRAPYAIDIPAVLDAAVETGTIIELNAGPFRLDLDWRWWKTAKEKGVRCAINPDAHSVAGLQDLVFGVGAARKGWLERADVVNCLPLQDIQNVLRAKRGEAP